MARRHWVIGGEHRDPDFRALMPGTETMAGPFENETRARTEWTGLAGCPDLRGAATVRYSIASGSVH